jgi:AraC family transcriptional regulator
MSESAKTVEPIRFENAKPMLIAGFGERLTMVTMRNIPQIWRRFGPLIGRIPGQIGRLAYGVASNLTPSPFAIDYLAGVEVSSVADLPTGFSHIGVLAAHYAVFAHSEHATKIAETVSRIWEWLPGSGYIAAGGTRDIPAFIERYGEAFDPIGGKGDIEIWIPVRPESAAD